MHDRPPASTHQHAPPKTIRPLHLSKNKTHPPPPQQSPRPPTNQSSKLTHLRGPREVQAGVVLHILGEKLVVTGKVLNLLRREPLLQRGREHGARIPAQGAYLVETVLLVGLVVGGGGGLGSV